MKIIKRASDNTVLFAGDDLTLDITGCGGAGWLHRGITTNNAVIEAVDALPDEFEPGQWTYAGGFWTPSSLVADKQLSARKSAKLAELQTAYEAANYADIDHASKTWKADQVAQQLLVAVLAPGSVPPGMYWRDITETQNAMTFSDLQALARAILDRGLLLDSNLDTKKAAVEAVTTAEEVNAITWGD